MAEPGWGDGRGCNPQDTAAGPAGTAPAGEHPETRHAGRLVAAVEQEIERLERELAEVRARMKQYLKELGV